MIGTRTTNPSIAVISVSFWYPFTLCSKVILQYCLSHLTFNDRLANPWNLDMEYSTHSNMSQTENENENSNTLDKNERKKVKEAFEESEHEHSSSCGCGG